LQIDLMEGRRKRGFLLSSYQLHGSLRGNCFAQKIDCLLAATKMSKASMNVNMGKNNFLENGISFCTVCHVHWCFCSSDTAGADLMHMILQR
jgi:hypothetical protein